MIRSGIDLASLFALTKTVVVSKLSAIVLIHPHNLRLYRSSEVEAGDQVDHKHAVDGFSAFEKIKENGSKTILT